MLRTPRFAVPLVLHAVLLLLRLLVAVGFRALLDRVAVIARQNHVGRPLRASDDGHSGLFRDVPQRAWIANLRGLVYTLEKGNPKMEIPVKKSRIP